MLYILYFTKIQWVEGFLLLFVEKSKESSLSIYGEYRCYSQQQ